MDQWDHNDFAAVGMYQYYGGGDGTRLSFKEESASNKLITKMIPRIIKRGVEAGKSTSEIMQEVFELADKDYAMRQSGVASLEALIERERAAVQQPSNISKENAKSTLSLEDQLDLATEESLNQRKGVNESSAEPTTPTPKPKTTKEQAQDILEGKYSEDTHVIYQSELS